ncbi:MAG: NAD(P)H-dependent oxidoreductase [Oscillospiraceae bacterium]|nr:NAD(P)H-dependent oxidoreductase [Oscillospiraceae bacterium]
MSILFINACVRKDSRTLRLAKHLLSKLDGEITELNLEKENIQALTQDTLAYRDTCLHCGKFGDPMLSYANQFANAETIVIAAPFWDMSFPSSLKNYIEAITVSGVTFTYVNGIPKGLCKGKKLYFVSTCGGPFTPDFGYNYIKTMAQGFYGIPETQLFTAEFLDVIGNDVEAILKAAEESIDKTF